MDRHLKSDLSGIVSRLYEMTPRGEWKCLGCGRVSSGPTFGEMLHSTGCPVLALQGLLRESRNIGGHTPGPWRVDPTDRHEVLTSDNRFRILLTTQGLGGRTEEWAANARLIAAAPDLLALAGDFVEEVNRMGAAAMSRPTLIEIEEKAIRLIRQIQRKEGDR